MKISKKKLKQFFILNILLILVAFTFLVFVIFFLNKNDILSIIFAVLMIFTMYLLLKNNQRFEYERHVHIYEKMLEDKIGVRVMQDLPNKNELHKKLVDKLEFKEYKIISHGKLYYKVDKSFSNKRKHKTLYAFKVIENNQSFETSMALMFDKLEDSLYQKEKYNQRIFYQYKEVEGTITDEMIDDADKMFFLNKGDTSLVILNVIYSKTTKELYFLKTKSYLSMAYIDYATKYLAQTILK